MAEKPTMQRTGRCADVTRKQAIGNSLSSDFLEYAINSDSTFFENFAVVFLLFASYDYRNLNYQRYLV